MNPKPDSPALFPREIDRLSDDELNRWFEEKVQPCENGLRNWLRRRFPWLTDIDDLVQESYARLLRARIDGKVDRPKSYLFATARNAAFDLARRSRIVAIDSVAEMAELAILDERPGVPEALIHNQELEVLAAAIEALPQRCRLVVKLRKLRGLSYQEIAWQLNISVRTVNAQLAKGMLLCRAYMRRHGIDHHES